MNKKMQEDDGDQGAPEWMVTFSDCMTLLLTFFVLLLTFSSFDEKVFYDLRAVYSQSLPNPIKTNNKALEAMIRIDAVQADEDPDVGSERPTLSNKRKQGTMKKTEPWEFVQNKVFVADSANIFWGRSALISSDGKQVLRVMAELLDRVPGQIVISENIPGNESEKSTSTGLSRSWSIIDYFTKEEGIERTRFSISSRSTIPQNSDTDENTSANTNRRLEIVYLERSVQI